MITQERLKEVLNYDPETGAFTWISRPSNRVCVGDIAGNLDRKGYVRIRLFGVLHHAHRLAVFYMTGTWPQEIVDHENGIRNDNRWLNLRECSHAQNQQNSKTPCTNTSGFKGVTWHGQMNKWLAQINCDGQHFSLGLYCDRDDAAIAYDTAAAMLHGEFARPNFRS